MSDARRWLDSHGFEDGMAWEAANGGQLTDLLDETEDAEESGLWSGDDAESATYTPAYVWPDGSAVLLTDAWWDLVEDGRSGAGVALDDEAMDELANDASPDGWLIVRGSYSSTPDDRSDRWYATPDDVSRPVDRRGRGSASIAEALEDIRMTEEALAAR